MTRQVIIDANKLYQFLYYPHVDTSYTADNGVIGLGKVQHKGDTYDVYLTYPPLQVEYAPASCVEYIFNHGSKKAVLIESYMKQVHSMARGSLYQMLFDAMRIRQTVWMVWEGAPCCRPPMPPEPLPVKDMILRQVEAFLNGSLRRMSVSLPLPQGDYEYLVSLYREGLKDKVSVLNFLKDIARGGYKSDKQGYLAQPALFYVYGTGVQARYVIAVKPRSEEGDTTVEWLDMSL